MSASVSDFLEYYTTHPPTDTPDPARKLYAEHVASIEELRNSCGRCSGLIRPVKDKKGWGLSFVNASDEDLQLLADEIDAKESKINEIEQRIGNLLAITKGQSIAEITMEQNRISNRLLRAQVLASATKKRLLRLNPKISASKLAKMDDVVATEQNLENIKAEFEPRAQELQSRLLRISEILNPAQV